MCKMTYEAKAGDKVMLNYNKIINLPDYSKMQKPYREFIEKNKGKVFTVKTIKKYEPKNLIVTFEEDDTWYFTSAVLNKMVFTQEKRMVIKNK